MARGLLIEVFGDAKQFAGEMDKAAGKTKRIGAVAKVAGAAILGGLVFGLEKSVKAAMEGQVSQAQLDKALQATHQSVEKMTPALEAAEAASRKLGFSDDETRSALAKLEIASGSTKESIRALGVAQDLARFKSVPLEQATRAITMAYGGSTRALKQLGLVLPTVTAAQDAVKNAFKKHTGALYDNAIATAKAKDKANQLKDVIALVTEKVHGQADAYSNTAAGGLAQFHAQTQHLQETIGNQLLPVLTKVVDALASMLDWLSKHPAAMKAVEVAVIALTVAFGALAAAALVADLIASPWIAAAVAIISAGVAIYIFRDKITAVMDWIKTNWPLIAEIIAGPIGIAVNQVVKHFDDFRAAFRSLRDAALGPLGAIVGAFRDLPGELKGAITAGAQAIVAAIAGLASSVANAFKQIPAETKGAIADAIHAVVGFADDAFSAAKSIGLAMVRGMRDGVSGLADAMLGVGKGVGKAIGNAIIGILNDIIDKVNDALTFHVTVDTHIPGIGKVGFGYTSHIPHIPGLAMGGIVTSPTLAFLGEQGPEAVIPLSGGGGLGNITVNVYGSVTSERDLAEAIRQRLLTTGRQNGTIWGQFA